MQGLGRGPRHCGPPRPASPAAPNSRILRSDHPQPGPPPSSLHPSLRRQPPLAPTEHRGKLNPMPTCPQRCPRSIVAQTYAGPSHQERVKGGLAAGTRGMITGWKYFEGVNGKKGEG